jgi:hypothetical protein
MRYRHALHPFLIALSLLVLLTACGRGSNNGIGAQPSASPFAASFQGDVHNLNWKSVLQNDPDLESRPASGGGTVSDIFVRYKGDQVAGEPDLQGITYGDLDADGHEEAVVPLHSGGTAGVVGFLVYGFETPTPRIRVAMGGYKLAPVIEGDQLRVTTPVYAGWEPNCCPSALKTTVYRLQGSTLSAVSERREPFAGARLLTVERFYDLLQARQYQEAYQFLSPTFQTANPFPAWSGGFATTQRITVNATENADGTIGITLSVVERRSGGVDEARRFTGRWSLVYSNDRNQWLLDRAEIAPSS